MSEEKNESKLSINFNKSESLDPFQEYREKMRKEREQMTPEELLKEVECLTTIGKLPSMADSNKQSNEKDLSKEDILQIAKEFYLLGVDFRIDDQSIQNGHESMYRTWNDQEVWCIM